MILLSLLAATGYLGGLALAWLAPEEVKDGKIYLHLFSRTCFLLILSIIFHPSILLLLFFPRRWNKIENLICAASSGVIIGFYGTPLITSLGFLSGLAFGSADINLMFAFLLGVLPGSVAYS